MFQCEKQQLEVDIKIITYSPVSVYIINILLIHHHPFILWNLLQLSFHRSCHTYSNQELHGRHHLIDWSAKMPTGSRQSHRSIRNTHQVIPSSSSGSICICPVVNAASDCHRVWTRIWRIKTHSRMSVSWWLEILKMHSLNMVPSKPRSPHIARLLML